MMFNLRQALSTFHADVYRYLFAMGIVGFSYFGFVSVLLNLYLLRLGYGTDFIGLVNGGIAFAFAACSLPAGALGSRLGMRRTAALGMALVAAGMTFVPVAGSLLSGAPRDVGIIAMRVLSGMGFSLYMVNAYPYLVAATGPRERTYAFALMSALPPLTGFAGSIVSGVLPGWIAPLLGLDLSHPEPFAVALIVAGVVLLPTVPAVASTSDREPAKRNPPRTETIRSSHGGGGRSAEGALYALIFVLAITALLRSAGEGAARTFINVYLEVDLAASPARIGVLLAIGTVAAGPAALIAPATGRARRQGTGDRGHRPAYRRRHGDPGDRPALGRGRTRLHAGGRAALHYSVGVRGTAHGDRAGEPAHGYVGSDGYGDGHGLHVDLVGRRLPDSGPRLPPLLSPGHGDHRRQRADFLALLPHPERRVRSTRLTPCWILTPCGGGR